MKNILICLFLISIGLSSCYMPPKNVDETPWTLYDTVIVVNKEIIITEGSFFASGKVRYMVAFNDSDYEYFNFGEYSCVEIGDTIPKSKLNTDYYWDFHIDCN